MKQLFLSIIISAFYFGKAQINNDKGYNFTLQEAINYAFKNNYKSINNDREIEISKLKRLETIAMGLPQINAGVDYLHNFAVTQQGISGNFFNPFLDPNTITTLGFGTKNTIITKASLSQLIFDGSYIVAIQASKTYLEFFKNLKKKSDLEIREMIVNEYANVLLAEESIKILEKNKSVLEKNYKDVNQIFKNGLTEEESVEQIAITLTTIKSSLENVKRLKEISLKMLKVNMGVDIESNLNLTDTLNDLYQNNLSISASENIFDVTKNIDYQISSNASEQKRLLVKLQRSKSLPTLGAAYNFGYNSFATDFTFFNTSQKFNYYSNLGVSLTIPIFSSFAQTAKVKQTRIVYEESKTQQKEIEQLLKLQFEKSKSDFEFSIEKYATAKINLSLAERIEKKQQIKFKEGLSTSFDLAEAQRQLYQSQENYLQSMVDIINKKAALEKLTQ